MRITLFAWLPGARPPTSIVAREVGIISAGAKARFGSDLISAAHLEGRYEIIRSLGEGGMGDVYLARHLSLRRLEALKVLRASKTKSFAARFRREARAMNRLRHQNIVNVYDFGQLVDGRFYLSMEYAEGQSVFDVLQAGRMEVSRCIDVLAQLADAIDHAHGQGVIHRDLKPNNLILSKSTAGAEIVRVLDFGVAKIIAPEYTDSVGITGNTVMGTPAYMSPEQLAGRGDEPRIDIYALGCIGFELLTGRPPFVGRRMEMCHAHMGKEPPRPSDIVGDGSIPAELEGVVLACRRKKPQDRPPSGAAIAAALRGAVPPRARPRRRRRSSVHGTFEYPALDASRPPATPARTRAEEAAAVQQKIDWQSALLALAEEIVDQGCTNAGLLLALTNSKRRDGEVCRILAEVEEIRRQGALVERAHKDQVSSLRFSLAELGFAKHGDAQSHSDQAAVEELVNELGGQLRSVEKNTVASLNELEVRRSELVERARAIEVERDEAYVALDELLASVIVEYLDEPLIEALAASADALRIAGQPYMTLVEEVTV